MLFGDYKEGKQKEVELNEPEELTHENFVELLKVLNPPHDVPGKLFVDFPESFHSFSRKDRSFVEVGRFLSDGCGA